MNRMHAVCPGGVCFLSHEIFGVIRHKHVRHNPDPVLIAPFIRKREPVYPLRHDSVLFINNVFQRSRQFNPLRLISPDQILRFFNIVISRNDRVLGFLPHP